MYQFRKWHIPERMMKSIQDYLDHHTPVGDFLRAIIENNLFAAIGRADDENLENIPAFVTFFFNEAPIDSWGSPEKYQTWINSDFFGVVKNIMAPLGENFQIEGE